MFTDYAGGDHSLQIGSPALTLILAYAGGSSPIWCPYGEILVDPTSASLFTTFAASVGGAQHSLAAPPD